MRFTSVSQCLRRSVELLISDIKRDGYCQLPRLSGGLCSKRLDLSVQHCTRRRGIEHSPLLPSKVRICCSESRTESQYVTGSLRVARVHSLTELVGTNQVGLCCYKGGCAVSNTDMRVRLNERCYCLTDGSLCYVVAVCVCKCYFNYLLLLY